LTALTAEDWSLRIRPSRDTTSETWLMLHPEEILRKPQSMTTSSSPRFTSSSLTASPALFTLESSESDPSKPERSELPLPELLETIKEELSLPNKRRKNEEFDLSVP